MTSVTPRANPVWWCPECHWADDAYPLMEHAKERHGTWGMAGCPGLIVDLVAERERHIQNWRTLVEALRKTDPALSKLAGYLARRTLGKEA